MSSFEQLHPAVQHHIVNSLGWRELRSFQEAVIPQLLTGQHVIILAPTAGGKTEAAFFPILSRMLAEGWSGLSVLYICPIKTLLNNLDLRLQRYCSLFGRRSAVWHGDIQQATRRQILRDHPDCLLTTPESLEVMLISPNVDARSLFQHLQVVIVDEVHAFAGDDRGWHLLAVLSRITRLAGRELQRIGLSATVGNSQALVDWLAGCCQGQRSVCVPPKHHASQAEVTLDYVGSLGNAAVVISRLYRGEKRLVFVDSRARAEQLVSELRHLDVTTFVIHSSLSQDQRTQAEEAFASRDDCVIVGTSVLELGIDVGDLDRVIQIDAPPTVASLLQRMGRTGRRAGKTRNCLFLATRDEALMQAAGLIDLWVEGYIEPIMPPPEPYHIFAQQLMALVLQENGIGRREWRDWFSKMPAFVALPAEQGDGLVTWMLEQEILWDEQGMLWLGRTGEHAYGRRNFLKLLSVFTSPPLFSVRQGRHELGFVDELSFFGKQDDPRVLLLGGRAWRVTYIDWHRRVAYVEATTAKGRSRWTGNVPDLSFRLCQAVKHVLATRGERAVWSKRARQHLQDMRDTFAWLSDPGTVVIRDATDTSAWWTFAGVRTNATLASELSQTLQSRVTYDSFALTFEPLLPMSTIEQALQQLRHREVSQLHPAVDERAIAGLKFSACLPYNTALHLLHARLSDPVAIEGVLSEPVRFVVDR